MAFGVDDNMAMDELFLLERTLDNLSRLNMTAWERGFVEDMIDRVERYQERTKVSVAQEDIIERLQNRYL